MLYKDDRLCKDENTVYADEFLATEGVDYKVMKKMADILCQQNLITPDEKSRLILLIDKGRE